MATNKAKRSIHLAQPQPQRTELKPVRAHAYRSLAEMNTGLEQAIQGLQALQKINLFSAESLNATSTCFPGFGRRPIVKPWPFWQSEKSPMFATSSNYALNRNVPSADALVRTDRNPQECAASPDWRRAACNRCRTPSSREQSPAVWSAATRKTKKAAMLSRPFPFH